ncbi:MAG TPA: multiheme c-type cytochrome [Candidatus Acidoferrales bacterium]|nr:multiheme c-type cytochrome [Candidatus Acidoferrales bacterium]
MSKTICHPLIVTLLCAPLCGLVTARGADAPAKFLGATSCASSGCHGGGGEKQNQFLTWSLKDFHSQRPAATLTTARSRQIGEALGIKDPTAEARCTTCHAPLHDVPDDLRGKDFKVSEGVSCESCHGPSENWLRAHTRHDYTRADRTAAGMRDLQNLYVRANTCVACHQVVSQPLLKAGHPELIFELDGQSVAEPKHWSVEKNGNGAQAWFVGQAVALRELSWQVAHETAPTQNLVNRWAGLAWLLQTASLADNLKTPASTVPAEAVTQAAKIQGDSDAIARDTAVTDWTDAMTGKALTTLAGSAAAFRDASVPPSVQARRAERLVLALDRLLAAQNNHKADAELNQLFKLAQSVPDFDPAQFATALEKFAAAVSIP